MATELRQTTHREMTGARRLWQRMEKRREKIEDESWGRGATGGRGRRRKHKGEGLAARGREEERD